MNDAEQIRELENAIRKWQNVGPALMAQILYEDGYRKTPVKIDDWDNGYYNEAPDAEG